MGVIGSGSWSLTVGIKLPDDGLDNCCPGGLMAPAHRHAGSERRQPAALLRGAGRRRILRVSHMSPERCSPPASSLLHSDHFTTHTLAMLKHYRTRKRNSNGTRRGRGEGTAQTDAPLVSRAKRAKQRPSGDRA